MRAPKIIEFTKALQVIYFGNISSMMHPQSTKQWQAYQVLEPSTDEFDLIDTVTFALTKKKHYRPGSILFVHIWVHNPLIYLK